MSKLKSKNYLSTLLQVAALVAIEIVLTRFCSISAPFVKIGFGFVPIAICGMLFGPVWAGIAGGMADFIGAVAFPFVGAYFPGFTLCAALYGVVYGFFLHRKEVKWYHITMALVLNNLIISMFLSTYFIHMLYGAPYWSLMPVRILQNAILIAVEFVVLRVLQRPVFIYALRTHAQPT